MTNEELNVLMERPYTPFVYADRSGMQATMTSRHFETRIVEVPVDTPGIVLSRQDNSITISWDHYYFENHRIQELLPNPVTVLESRDFELVRINRFPPNVMYC